VDLSPFPLKTADVNTAHLTRRAIWGDNREGITFVRISQFIICLSCGPTRPGADERKKISAPTEFIELIIHEQLLSGL